MRNETHDRPDRPCDPNCSRRAHSFAECDCSRSQDPDDRLLADLELIEASHIARVQSRALTCYGALGQLVACFEDYSRHGAACAQDLIGALRVAKAELARIEGRAA